MKRILSLIILPALALFVLSSFSIRESPQDPPRGKKVEKRIKMVKVDDEGKKIEIDTVLSNDEVFVWNGDTITGGKELKWITKDDFNMDSLAMDFDFDFEYEIDEDGEGNVFIMKSGKHGEHIVAPMGNVSPHAPHVMMWHSKKDKNVIDLSDPGIISYDKKMLRDGTEKITIVRKPKPEGEEEEEEIIIHSPHGNAMFMGDSPQKVHKIKVIKKDDGTTEVIEDENVFHIKEGDGTAKFIGDDGKVVIIKEKKEGDEKKIEVIVEEEKENN